MSACASDLEAAELVPIDKNVAQFVLQNHFQEALLLMTGINNNGYITKKWAAYHRLPNINIISYSISFCLFSVFITFQVISYGTSHLEKYEFRMYYEDTKKE